MWLLRSRPKFTPTTLVLLGERGGCGVGKRLRNAVLYSQPDFFLDFKSLMQIASELTNLFICCSEVHTSGFTTGNLMRYLYLSQQVTPKN